VADDEVMLPDDNAPGTLQVVAALVVKVADEEKLPDPPEHTACTWNS
jgi:hypothetical protein